MVRTRTIRIRIAVWAVGVVAGLGQLSAQEPAPALPPELTSRLGELMDRDWEQRPPWADMAVAILKGGGMGSGQGWFTGAERRHAWDWLVANFPEAAADEKITPKEIPQLSRFAFERVDVDRDRVLAPQDFQFDSHPQLEDNSPVGAIFSRIDQDSNGRITQDELSRWFERAAGDTEFLSVEDLKLALGLGVGSPGNRRSVESESRSSPPPDPRWEMLGLLLNGEMGALTEGPALDAPAPELDLPMVRRSEDAGGLELTDRLIRLEDLHGTKPVVLIFGSFT